MSKATETKNDQNGNQRSEKGTGRLMWSTQVFVLDETGGEVITMTTAGEKPDVKVGQLVTVEQLEAIPWATNGRNGIAFRAVSLKALTSASAQVRLSTHDPYCPATVSVATASSSDLCPLQPVNQPRDEVRKRLWRPTFLSFGGHDR